MASQAPRDLENRLKILLIAPWGNPTGWREVSYKPQRIPDKCRPTEQEGYSEAVIKKSSTLAIVESIEKGKHLQKTPQLIAKIIVAETLAKKEEIDRCRENLDRVEKIKECIDQHVEKEIREQVEEQIREPKNHLEIKVAPAIGIFPPIAFKGHAYNYWAYILIETLKNLNKIDPDVVIVDITHGINYMPVTTLDAVRKAVEIHLLRRKTERKTKIIAMNSDPIRIGREAEKNQKPQELHIHIIKCEELDTTEAMDRAYREIDSIEIGNRFTIYNRLREETEETQAEDEATLNTLDECANELKERIKDLKVFVRAARLGLPIAIAIQAEKLSEEQNRTNPCIEDKLAEALKIIRIKSEGEHIIVRRNIAVKPESLIVALIAEILPRDILDTISNKKHEIKKHGDTILFTPRHLREVIERYIVDNAARKIASHELSDIKDRLECVKHNDGYEVMKSKGTPIPWGAIYDAMEKAVDRDQSFIDMCRRSRSGDRYRLDQELASKLREELEKSIKGYEALRVRRPCTYGDPQPRNFYAHAGFEKNVAMVYIDREDRVWIGYEKGCWEGKIRGMIAGSS
ncbi:MAG: TM1812 family CRISPR-associated protein [Sulfolobales archaeon]